MNRVVGYHGKLSYHLYEKCPAMLRWKHSEFDNGQIGRRMMELVEVDGPDCCDICAIAWRTDGRL